MRDPAVARAIRRPAVLAAGVCLIAGTAACGPVGGSGSDAGDTTLTVFAAASLTEPFTELAATFEEQRPGVSVEFNFAGSATLAQQIGQGAPADVFASADLANMAVVTGESASPGEAAVFAENTLEIAVPPGNPAGIEEFGDLARDGVAVALCAPEVPCGTAAHTAMAEAGVQITPVSQEEDVKAALTKVRLGEVDAALVYRSDVHAAGGDVEGIGFPAARNAVNEYPITVVEDAPEPELAEQWTALVGSDDGAEVLSEAGFTAVDRPSPDLDAASPMKAP